jgi:hypothetical protein
MVASDGVILPDGGGDVEGCRLVFGQNSHLRNLLISFLGKRSVSWYVEHKIYTYNKAFVVQLFEHSCLAL